MQNRFWYLLSKRLSGIATDAEITELEELQAAHPEWQYPAERIATVWECNYAEEATEGDYYNHLRRMERLGYETNALGLPEINEPEFVPVSSRRRWWIATGIAASVVGIIMVFIFLSKDSKPPAPIAENSISKNEVVTRSGNRSKLTLPDGTQVWLNADSKLEYSDGFGTRNRDVTLSGEAYFDVVKNTSLPFIIETKKIKIRVTGTIFNVKAYPGEGVSETSLIRGRVEVTVNARPDEKYILKPNEKIVVRDEMPAAMQPKTAADGLEVKQSNNEPHIQLGYVNYLENDTTAIETSWVYNRLIFDNESFEEIAHKMERWYGISIKIADAKVAATRFTYQIKNETIAQALRNMQYAARFHFAINNNIVSITK